MNLGATPRITRQRDHRAAVIASRELPIVIDSDTEEVGDVTGPQPYHEGV